MSGWVGFFKQSSRVRHQVDECEFETPRKHEDKQSARHAPVLCDLRSSRLSRSACRRINPSINSPGLSGTTTVRAPTITISYHHCPSTIHAPPPSRRRSHGRPTQSLARLTLTRGSLRRWLSSIRRPTHPSVPHHPRREKFNNFGSAQDTTLAAIHPILLLAATARAVVKKSDHVDFGTLFTL